MLVIKSHKDLDTRQSLRAIDPFCIDQTDTKAMQAQIKPGPTIPPLERGCRGIETSQCIKAPLYSVSAFPMQRFKAFTQDQTDTKAMQAQIKPGATIPPLERGCRGIETSQYIKAPLYSVSAQPTRGFGGDAAAQTPNFLMFNCVSEVSLSFTKPQLA